MLGFLLPLPPAGGGGFQAWAEEAPVGVACEGDECQGPAPAPDDPTPGTAVVEGPSNPPVRFPKTNAKKHQKKKHAHRRHRQRSVTR